MEENRKKGLARSRPNGSFGHLGFYAIAAPTSCHFHFYFMCRFLYKSVLLSFSLNTVWIYIFCKKNFEAKTDEIDDSCQ